MKRNGEDPDEFTIVTGAGSVGVSREGAVPELSSEAIDRTFTMILPAAHPACSSFEHLIWGIDVCRFTPAWAYPAVACPIQSTTAASALFAFEPLARASVKIAS